MTEETTGAPAGAAARGRWPAVLSFTETPPVRGHSIEFRINAEDPGRGYLGPRRGASSALMRPVGPGVRLDTGVASGSSIPGSFDLRLMAASTPTGATRASRRWRGRRRALQEFRIEGVASVPPFHRAVVQDAAYRPGRFWRTPGGSKLEMAARFDSAARPEAEAEGVAAHLPGD
ncbi:MAG: hypothetical protein U1E57_04115 [Paenacidovorax caeni]